MRLLRFIASEFKNNRRFTILFILNLSFGLSGFIALDGFKHSLDHTLKERSKGALGADFGLSARRPITLKERETVRAHAQGSLVESQITELYSMVANKNGQSRLVQIKAIEPNYPFYGEIKLEKSSEKLNFNKRNPIWIYPELALQLQIQTGEKLRLGEAEFVIEGIIKRDSAAGLTTSMAPRVYISLNDLSQTQLIKKGSLAWYSFVYHLPSMNSEGLSQLRDEIFEKIDNPDLQVYTHENVSEMMGRLLTYLNDFLGLTALCALFLAAVGSAFLFRAYLRKKIKEMAILLSLGMTHGQVFRLIILQLTLLGGISTLIAYGFSLGLIPWLSALTNELIPAFSISFQPSWNTWVVGLLLGVFGSVLIGLPLLMQLRKLNPSVLFVDDQQVKGKWDAVSVLMVFFSLAIFWGLSVWQANSLVIGSLFFASFFGAGLLLALISWAIFQAFQKLRGIKNLSLKWALRDLARQPLATTSCFLSLSLGMLLLNLIPQVQATIEKELKSPEESKLPSLFLFDLQEEQLSDFKVLLKQESVNYSQLSPLVRARLAKVNGAPFDKGKGESQAVTREEEREMRFRNRGFNLTYREELTAAEDITEGRDFSGRYTENQKSLPEISLEMRFADRLNLKIGDRIAFDIQGVEVEGRVVNLRKVRWTSFQPNFFIQFQPGVLDLAPKTFLITIPRLKKSKKNQLQNTIVNRLPNVSIIDVTRLVDRLRGITEQMGWALQFMAVLCLIAGFVVLYSIANYQAQSRQWDIGLLKALGLDFSSIQNLFLWQFTIIAFFAALLGLGFSLLFSYVLSILLFDTIWVYNGVYPLISFLGCILMALAVTYLAVQRALKIKPINLLGLS